jgi:phage terminase large subunit
MITLLKHQSDFIEAQEKYVLLAAGIGAGKTWSGSHYTINKCVTDGRALGLICANTYKQLRNSTLASLFRELDILGIRFSYNENKGLLELCGSRILCLSLENYDYIRGIEIGWFWADEVRDTKEDAFMVLVGRLRDKRCKLEGRLTSSPDGYNWLYDYFAGEKKTKDFRLINADTRDNDYLPDGYVNSLIDIYDPKLAEQEIGGKFVNITSGNVYYAFSRQNHVKEFEKKQTPQKIGQDFNYSPGTAVMGYYENDCFYIWDEVYQLNSNTYEVADIMLSKWGVSDLYPDSTGKARKTSAVKSDHEILRDKGFIVHYTTNPHVKDRYNCANGLFAKNKIIIHPRCKMLIKDLEQLSHDNKDELLSHISDALGYMVWSLSPLKRPQTPSRCINI